MSEARYTALAVVVWVCSLIAMAWLARRRIGIEQRRARDLLRDVRERCSTGVCIEADYFDVIARFYGYTDWRAVTVGAGEHPPQDAWEERRALRVCRREVVA